MKKFDIFYNQKTGEMFFEGISCVMLSKDTKSLQQRECERIIGPTTKTIIYNATKMSSRDMFFNIIADAAKDAKSKKELVLKIIKLFPKMGYGIFSLNLYNEEALSFQIVGKNCYNISAYKNSQKPICYGMSGTIAALFESIFEEEMICEEKECEGMGSENCIFVINSLGKKIEFTKKLFPKIEFTKDFLKTSKLIFDENKGEIISKGINSVIHPRAEMSEIEMKFERIIGPVTKTIFYNSTKKGAIEGVKDILKNSIIARIVKKISKKKFISELFKVADIRGYGALKLVYLDKKNAEVKVIMENCFETIPYKKKNSKKPVCYSMLGIVAGASEVVFDRKMEAIETKCRAQGYEYCEFYAHPIK